MTLYTTNIDHHEVDTVNLQAGAMSIGRAPDNDLRLTDTTVSSHHAKIFTYLDASYIEDLGSTNGTFLNGKRIQKHTLHSGDIIKLGKHVFEVSANN